MLVSFGIKGLNRPAQKLLMRQIYLHGRASLMENFFSGLESYPQHELAKKQMTGFGGIVTFFIKGNLENSRKFFKSSKVTIDIYLIVFT